MSGLARRLTHAGAPVGAAATSFATLLRDVFRLTVTGDNPDLADIASSSLAAQLREQGMSGVDAVVDQVMGDFGTQPVHPP